MGITPHRSRATVVKSSLFHGIPHLSPPFVDFFLNRGRSHRIHEYVQRSTGGDIQQVALSTSPFSSGINNVAPLSLANPENDGIPRGHLIDLSGSYLIAPRGPLLLIFPHGGMLTQLYRSLQSQNLCPSTVASVITEMKEKSP